MPRARAALVVLLVVSGCKKGTVAADRVDAAVAIVDADAAPDAGPLVDLLYSTYAVVVVSSRVDNPRDLPEHIVDRRTDTAWNGRAGDLVGGFVAFRVPSDATVDFVRVHAGFDKKTDGEDLFTANVRIEKLRVYRNKVLLREVALDPNERGAQTIAIGTAGGDFKLEVREVAQGTSKSGRVLAVSELSVWGRPGAVVRERPTAPPVHVGGLDPTTTTVEHPSAFKTLDSACEAFARDGKLALDVAKAVERAPPDDSSLMCRPGVEVTQPHAPFTAIRELDEVAPLPGAHAVTYTGAVLGLRTAAGAFATNVRLHGRETSRLGTATYELLGTSWAGDKLVVQVLERRSGDLDVDRTSEELRNEVASHVGTVCHLSGDQVTCRSTVTPLSIGGKARVRPSPVRTSDSGEVTIEVADAR